MLTELWIVSRLGLRPCLEVTVQPLFTITNESRGLRSSGPPKTWKVVKQDPGGSPLSVKAALGMTAP